MCYTDKENNEPNTPFVVSKVEFRLHPDSSQQAVLKQSTF